MQVRKAEKTKNKKGYLERLKNIALMKEKGAISGMFGSKTRRSSAI